MNGVDYTRQLAKDREHYRDSVKKNNESNEKRLADTNARHEHIQNKQRDSFVENKNELEKDYQTNLESLREKTKKTLEGNQDDYQKNLTSERDKFIKDSENKRKDFDQRFSDIKNGYRKAFDSEKEMHKDIQGVQKNKYDKHVSENRRNSDEKLKEYQEKMLGSGSTLKDQYNKERQQLVRAHEDHLKNVYKENSSKQADLKERIGQDIKKTKEVAEADAEQTKRYAENRMGTMQRKFQDRYETMASDYGEKNADLSERQQRENLKSNKENQEKLLDVRRDFNRQMRSVELEKRRMNNGSGDFAEVMDQQKGLNDKIQHENQMRSMRSKLVDAQRQYQDRASLEQDSFNETLKTENAEGNVRLERKLNEVNAEKLSTIAHEREKNTKQLNNLTHISKQERSAYEQQLMLERNNANHRLNKLKENFNQSMVALEEKSKLSLEEVTKVANEDKTEFVKKMNESRNQEVFEMRREFDKMMNATVEDYEKRLATYQRDNENLKMTMDQKVHNIVDQTEKQMASQSKIFEGRRAADLKAQALIKDEREFQFKTSTNELNNNFQKKLDKMQVTNDMKLKLLTNDYENKLKELRASSSKAITEKDLNQQIEQGRLKQAYEAEKMRVVNGYENQIAEMKKSHSVQIDQLKEYKRLS